jgi:hypothetical protein
MVIHKPLVEFVVFSPRSSILLSVEISRRGEKNFLSHTQQALHSTTKTSMCLHFTMRFERFRNEQSTRSFYNNAVKCAVLRLLPTCTVIRRLLMFISL